MSRTDGATGNTFRRVTIKRSGQSGGVQIEQGSGAMVYGDGTDIVNAVWSLAAGGTKLVVASPFLTVEEGRALLDFAGCAVVISHDRWFLDRIATHMLAFEGDSQVVWFEGNYSDYEEDRKRRLGKDADRPHRIKYRHLTR